MASGFFAILDDIGALMDDVVVMSKITTKKTASILGDDLAVSSEKASGFESSRELPILCAIAKGSFLNKLIILPIAFLSKTRGEKKAPSKLMDSASRYTIRISQY